MTDSRAPGIGSSKFPISINGIGSAIAIVVLLVTVYGGAHFFAPSPDSDERAGTEQAGPTGELHLSETKIEAGGFRMALVEQRQVQRTRTVAATVGYDASRHVEIRAPIDCLIEEMSVSPGTLIEQGDSLLVLSGGEAALARSEVKKCEADLAIATLTYEWNQETQTNLKEFVADLRQFPDVEVLKTKYSGKKLGEQRDQLFGAYAQLLLASSVAERTTPLTDQGIISGRVAEERFSERDRAAMEFESICEAAAFKNERSLVQARSEMELAHSRLDVARERLRLLLGPFAVGTDEELDGRFDVVAPFDGQVGEVSTSAASRHSEGDVLLQFADVSKLWVSALIHQHDWKALQASQDSKVHVSIPAMPEQAFEAEIRFVGTKVETDTRAVDVVGVLDNEARRLRPGMFAWVDLPLEPPYSALTVPTAALQRHDGDAFVFTVVGPGHYRQTKVRTGLETADYVVIEEGLTRGQEVVSEGAFFLKSELLLEHEE